MKRLKSPTGEVANSTPKADDTPEQIVRAALLVHTGPNGDPITFQSGDGEISFDADRIKDIVDSQNGLTQSLIEGYGGRDKMPIGAFPPILDQHETDSTIDRIVGRLTGELKFEIRDVPGVGEKCACAISEITFLGRKSVERAKDGRIYHLSIGIDEATNTLGEVSVVIQPAAPGAMLLKKGFSKRKGVQEMANKQLAAQAKERMKKLSAMQDALKKLGAEAKQAKQLVSMTRKQNDVASRLTKLMAGKKLTPAEFKQMSIKKLARLDEDALNIVLSTFEARQDVISPNQKGSSAAIEASQIAKGLEEKQLSRLKGEMRKDFKRMGIKLKESEEDKKDMSMEDKAKSYKDDKELDGKDDKKEMSGGSSFHKHMAHLKACLEAGDVDGAKMHHDMCMKAMAEGDDETDMKKMSGDMMDPAMGEESKKNMDDTEKRLDELTTQMSRLAGMVSELMGSEKDEDSDMSLEEEDDDKKKDLSEEDEDKKKDLAEEDKAKDEKKKEMSETDEDKDKKKLEEEIKEDKKKA